MQLRYYGANATLSTISTTSFNLTSTICIKDEAEQTMKEDKKNQNEKKIDLAVEKSSPPSTEKKPTKTKIPISKLSIISILLTMGLGGFIYYHGHQQINLQRQTIAALQAEIATLKQTTERLPILEKQIDVITVDQQNSQTQLNNKFASTELTIDKLNNKLASVTNADTDNWLISEANYLIHLAGRKIWNDQDYTTALLLLKDADNNLAKANDASFLPARQAISKDIGDLSKVSIVDNDGLTLSLMRLSDELTELPLLSNYKDIDLGMTQYKEVPLESSGDTSVKPKDNSSISSSLSDWSSNLLKNYDLFLQKFISIKKINKEDDFNSCLAKAGQDDKQILRCQLIRKPISPDESLYLRENIRLRLFIAAQAIPKHQELVYQQALNDVDVWVNAYFDENSANVKTFLNELKNLQDQSISDKNIPEKLASSSEIEKLMKARVLSFLVK